MPRWQREEDDLENAYELLGLEDDAGEKEIKAEGRGRLFLASRDSF